MVNSAPLPDAMPANWVDRHAPTGLRPWLKLGRFDRPTGIWLLMLPVFQGAALASAMAHALPSPLLLLKICLGATFMRAAGCAYNDIVDCDVDAKVARTANRPIPAGQISVKQAWAFVLACCLVSFLILISLPPLAIALGAGSLALVAAYPFMKRITWWPQAWLGLTFNWGALLGFAAAAGTVSLPALLLYAAGLFWTLGYDTIYAIQDLEDDALAGVKSSARRLGGSAPQAVLGFYLTSLILLAAVGLAASLTPLFYLLLAAYAAHLVWQARRVRVDDGALALALFKSNTGAGVILFLAIVVGTRMPIAS